MLIWKMDLWELFLEFFKNQTDYTQTNWSGMVSGAPEE